MKFEKNFISKTIILQVVSFLYIFTADKIVVKILASCIFSTVGTMQTIYVIDGFFQLFKESIATLNKAAIDNLNLIEKLLNILPCFDKTDKRASEIKSLSDSQNEEFIKLRDEMKITKEKMEKLERDSPTKLAILALFLTIFLTVGISLTLFLLPRILPH